MSFELSVVWASRDDDYGDGVNDRLVRSINSIETQAKQLGIKLDLIVVDWNSPNGRSLKTLLRSKGVRGIRVIEVPNEIITSLDFIPKKPFVEYLAKNVGIRRAISSEVTILNPDVKLSKNLLKLCVDRDFLENSFLRADRLDYKKSPLLRKQKLRLHVRHGPNTYDKITLTPDGFGRLRSGSKPLHGVKLKGEVIIGPEGGVLDHYLLGMHTNAAGDFISASRINWTKIQGFYEDKWLTTMGDSAVISKFLAIGLRQIILPGSKNLFHEDHPSDPTRGGAWAEEMWPSLQDELTEIGRSKVASFTSQNSFGLGEIDCPEYGI